MNNITKMNKVRQDKVLDKVYRFSDGISTFRKRIEAGMYSHAECVDVPKIEYNRRKFNNMNHKEQAEYEKKLKETKKEYRLYLASDSSAMNCVSKLVYDYFKEIV